jgi:hypothetical protein
MLEDSSIDADAFNHFVAQVRQFLDISFSKYTSAASEGRK